MRVRIKSTPSSTDWYKIVADYSSRVITYEEDKLPALAGLAIEYGKASGKTYLAGLWKESLLDDLLWRQGKFEYSNEEPLTPAKYRAPSWSWASVDGIIIKPCLQLETFFTEVLCTFENSRESISRVKERDMWICLKGPLVSTTHCNGPHFGFAMLGNVRVETVMDFRTVYGEKRYKCPSL